MKKGKKRVLKNKINRVLNAMFGNLFFFIVLAMIGISILLTFATVFSIALVKYVINPLINILFA